MFLRNCFRVLKLLYILRMSECSDNMILDQFDKLLRDGLTKILQIDLDDKWRQVNLPIGFGGLGIRSAKTLAPCAFFASAASTRTLESSILRQSFRDMKDTTVDSTLPIWSSLSQIKEPHNMHQHIQKAWDSIVASAQVEL